MAILRVAVYAPVRAAIRFHWDGQSSDGGTPSSPHQHPHRATITPEGRRLALEVNCDDHGEQGRVDDPQR
ncbi:MAG: hypothetical protein M3Q23_14490, partial [Actinomycetota bacterium]|nr:hypothetical protein [Actinomycetota bacterium]